MPAVLIGSGGVTVVITNTSGNDPCQALPLARALQDSGYRSLLYFFNGIQLDREILSAAAAARSHGAKHVVLAGGSLGAAGSLVAASEAAPPVSGVISLSGEKSVRGLNALAAMPRLRVPLLLISEENDSYIPPTDARAMYQAAASRDKQLQILPGSDHAFQMLNGANSERVRQLILDFVATHG